MSNVAQTELQTFTYQELVDMRDKKRVDPWSSPYPLSTLEEAIRFKLESGRGPRG